MAILGVVSLVAEGNGAQRFDAFEIEPFGLLIQKTAGSGGARGIGPVAFIIALFVEGNQTEIFTADKQNTADFPVIFFYGGNNGNLRVVTGNVALKFPDRKVSWQYRRPGEYQYC